MTQPLNRGQFPDSDLTRHLARKAEEFDHRGGSPLELAQVLDRAGEIRRGRRMRATIVMAAAVLAIAVPTGMIAIDRDRTHEPSPAHPSPTTNTAPLALGDLHVGDSPHHGFAQDGTWQLRVAANGLGGLRGQVAAAAAVKDGAMVAMRRESGETTAYFIHEQGGTSEQSWPMESGSSFAVSASGNVAAFVEPDGTVVAVQDRGTEWYEVGSLPGSDTYTADAVVGEDCSGRSAEVTCQARAHGNGQAPQIWQVSPTATPERVLPGWMKLAGVTATDVPLFAGMTSASDGGSCSQVLESAGPDAKTLWKTCDHRLLSFSPDGNRLLASAAYADGAGDTELAVLDAHTGSVMLDISATEQAFIYQMVWEDDQHVLATVYEQGRWAVLRIGLDGSREYAVEPVEGADEMQSPFVLPTL